MNIGERVGDYEIVGILGAGGMGQVYKVRNLISNRVEAMKVLLPNLESDAGLADRFLREIQVQAALDHPNIARLHTAQVWNNQLLMVMEFVEGVTIEKMLETGAIGVRDSIGYIGQVLDALGYAHERGVVHRDLKPANIMLTPRGSIKLMDFGIARMASDRKLTQTGHTVGSLYYMSPEQIKGSQPDPRSDLYSLGITMYEMVTGRRPFEGSSDFSIMAAHLQQMPMAPIEVIPGIPPQLSDAILTSLAKEPEARFPSAQAFKEALGRVHLGGPIPDTMVLPGGPGARAPMGPPPVQQGFVGQPPPPPMGPPPVQPPHMQPPMQQQGYAPVGYPPPPPSKPASRRGLYMTLGSLATVAVIAGAIFLVPILRTRAKQPPVDPLLHDAGPVIETHDGKDSKGGNDFQQPSPNPVQPNPVQPNPVQPNPRPTPVTPAPKPVTPNPIQPNPVQPNPVQPNPQPTPVQPPPVTPNPVQPNPVQPTPVQPKPTPNPVVVAPPVNSKELNDLRELYNLISVRANAAKNGVKQMETQMRRQGLDMRGDIVEAESRMDYLMKESMDSIRAGDAVNGKRNLSMAERALEQIEKFLGR